LIASEAIGRGVRSWIELKSGWEFRRNSKVTEFGIGKADVIELMPSFGAESITSYGRASFGVVAFGIVGRC